MAEKRKAVLHPIIDETGVNRQDLLDEIEGGPAKRPITTGASVPEPPPRGGETSVTQALLDLLIKPSTVHYLACMAGEKGSAPSLVAAHGLIVERREYGVPKYGGELMTKNGRNPIEDARQELGDAMQYVMQARMEGLDVSSLRRLHDVLGMLLHIPEEAI
jgi:hypothetical protein